VCVKRVPDTGSAIAITDDGMSVDTRRLGFIIGPHEECAVEEAVQIVSAHGGSVTALTVGPPEADEQLRYAMAIGAGHGVRVETGAEELDAEATARAILRAVAELASQGRTFDLLLFGNESPDAGHSQVGIRVACELGLPMVAGIKGIEIDTAAGVATLRRDVAAGAEFYETPLPAAIAVVEGLNLPRYPSMRGRLRAMKAQLDEVPADVAPGGLRTVGLRQLPHETPRTVVLGTGADSAEAVVDVLEELGVMPT